MATQLNFILDHIELKTNDGLTLPGLWYESIQEGADTACIFLHGCGSSSVFYKSEKMKTFAKQLSKQGIHFLAFNNRGAHYIKKLTREINGEVSELRIGTALEKISECVPDIEASIRFVQERGVKKIILLGESTGANKIVVYNTHRPNNPVSAYVLVGGGDDMGLWARQFGFETWRDTLTLCKEKIASGEGESLFSTDLSKGIMSYQSLFDVLDPDGEYNCFPYTEYFKNEKWSKNPLFSAWSAVTKPTLVLYGSEDIFTYEHPRKSIEALRIYQSGEAKVTYQIVKNADHGFHGKEQVEIDRTITWWNSLTF